MVDIVIKLLIMSDGYFIFKNGKCVGTYTKYVAVMQKFKALVADADICADSISVIDKEGCEIASF